MGKVLHFKHPTVPQLSCFIDHELRPEDARHVAAHLKVCALCGPRHARLIRATRALDRAMIKR